MIDATKPCAACADGRHNNCTEGICGCIARHPDDTPLMAGFKRLKRQTHPEREAWVRGGWR